LDNKIILLLGKSGAGKDAIIKELKGYDTIVSWTSRPIRENEENGVAYHFKTKEQFLSEMDNFVETRSYNTLVDGIPDTWYYGIHKEDVQDDKKYKTIVDLQGFMELKEIYKERVVGIYVDVPDEERTYRAEARGSFNETEWNRRLQDDNIVFKDVLKHVNYTVKNIDLQDCIKEIQSLI